MGEPAAPPLPLPDGALTARVRDWFTWLHRHPELSFQERETAAFVARTLREMGYAPRVSVGHGPGGGPLHGVVAVLGESRPGPALAFRADLDALPLTEASGLPYSSETAGVMHACGHDAHTAMLLGAAAALKAGRRRGAPARGRWCSSSSRRRRCPPGGPWG